MTSTYFSQSGGSSTGVDYTRFLERSVKTKSLPKNTYLPISSTSSVGSGGSGRSESQGLRNSLNTSTGGSSQSQHHHAISQPVTPKSIKGFSGTGASSVSSSMSGVGSTGLAYPTSLYRSLGTGSEVVVKPATGSGSSALSPSVSLPTDSGDFPSSYNPSATANTSSMFLEWSSTGNKVSTTSTCSGKLTAGGAGNATPKSPIIDLNPVVPGSTSLDAKSFSSLANGASASASLSSSARKGSSGYGSSRNRSPRLSQQRSASHHQPPSLASNANPISASGGRLNRAHSSSRRSPSQTPADIVPSRSLKGSNSPPMPLPLESSQQQQQHQNPASASQEMEQLKKKLEETVAELKAARSELSRRMAMDLAISQGGTLGTIGSDQAMSTLVSSPSLPSSLPMKCSTTGGGMPGGIVGDRHLFLPDPLLASTAEIKRHALLGGSHSVYRASMAGFTFVLKRITQTLDTRSFHEIEILEKLDHPNIIKYLGHEKASPLELNIYLEYIPFSLEGYMKRLASQNKQFHPKEMLHVCLEVAKGLHYLHCKAPVQIIHRDLKSRNILVDVDADEMIRDVKLCDFGVSKIMNSETAANTLVGTYYWMAPEILANDNQSYTTKADIWSYGMVVIELTTLKPPYNENGREWMVTKKMILEGQPPKFNASACPPLAKQLIRGCLRKKPEERPDAMDIVVHLTTNM